MSEKRVPLYDRLPEIYRIKDEEQVSPGQLKSYLALVETIFGAIHENIESLYHDLFIETCDEWVIPYIGDLLGTTHLKGNVWTLRADVADTIALRRRKGTLGAIERLTYDLTQWGVHCVELRENLVWNQHLNHQRPDIGGQPPYASATHHTVIQGGTMTLRDPAMLSLLNTPFDPFAHTADLKPSAFGNIRYNLPNLSIFLWRLVAYRIPVAKPGSRGIHAGVAGGANFVVRFDVHPLGEPVQLFNVNRFKPDMNSPIVSSIDQTPNPIPSARLTSDAEAGAPEQYVTVETYDPANPSLDAIAIADTGLQLHVPRPEFDHQGWKFRGTNLCAWETGLKSPLQNQEVAIDPTIGRIAIGVEDNNAANVLVERLLLTYTYGAVGAVGAHPISRLAASLEWEGQPVIKRDVNFHRNPHALRDALNNIENLTAPLVIEIGDSMTHELDISTVAGVVNEAGRANLSVNRSLIIRAASNQRPVIKLSQPLRFRPTHVFSSNPQDQAEFDAVMDYLTVRLEGLYLTRNTTFPAGEPLIARAALNSLELLDCTLDPGGFRQLNGTRAPIQTAIALDNHYGFALGSAELLAFKQTPKVIVQRSIAGPLLMDSDYLLFLTDAILDAGKGVGDDPETSFAVASASDAANQWGPPTTVNAITVFGRMRVESIGGKGGIWVQALEVLNHQKGCLKFSYFSGRGDRLPQNHACVTGTAARLRFVSEIFGQPAYGQLHYSTDFRIREQGPNDDAMGAFGFLLEAHKWRNLQIRYREFMPVGVRPLLIPVT
jgi:hypothetical protein